MNNHCKTTIPLLSVIIPARNEENTITRCLNNIISNGYPQDKLEIIVVNGGSTDNTVSVLHEYNKKHRGIKVLENPQKVTPAAFNIGIKYARGSLIAIIGAHNYISKSYLLTAAKYLQENNVDCVGGIGTCIPADKKLITKAISSAINSRFGVGNSFRTNCPKEVVSADTVASPVYKREVLKKIGLFDEELLRGQDAELNARLRKNGGRILLVPEVVSYYYARDSLPKLWKMYFQYGYFRALIVKKIKSVFTYRQLIPAAFIASLVISAILTIAYKPFLWLFLFISGSYIIANLVFSVKISLKKDLKYSFALPLVFATLHFSYGIGYLKGLWDFIIFKKDKKGKIQDMPLTR